MMRARALFRPKRFVVCVCRLHVLRGRLAGARVGGRANAVARALMVTEYRCGDDELVTRSGRSRRGRWRVIVPIVLSIALDVARNSENPNVAYQIS